MFSDTMHEKTKGIFSRIILGIVILSFALFGVETYQNAGGSAKIIAEVGDSKVLMQNFEESFKKQQARLREAGERNPKVLNSSELKNSVLDSFINERLLLSQAYKLGYKPNEAAILAFIQSSPEMQENGKFSEERFRRILENQNLTQKQYLAGFSQEQLTQELLVSQAQSTIFSRNIAAYMAGILSQQREIAKAILPAASFAAQAKIEPAQIQAYYDAHPELTRVPEQARVEYIVFSADQVLGQIQVSEADAKAYYATHIAQFTDAESREVAHILIRATTDAKPAERKAAQEKAQQLLLQAQNNPATFAMLAKQNSQDPLTAPNGGSFGLIQRGSIFKQVEDAAFGMKVGDIRGPIQTPAGLHIVMLKGITEGKQRSFEAVKDMVTEAAKREMALRKFNTEVEPFGDAVYSKSDSLKPAAEKYKLDIQSSDWFGRQGPAQGILKNERLLNAIFSNDAIQNKRNTEAIEVATNTLVAARILEHKAAGNKPLASVKDEIESRLRKDQASALAAKQGQLFLADLLQGKTLSTLSFSTPTKIGREDLAKSGLELASMEAVYRTSVKKLPAFTGVTQSNGDYALFKISAVNNNDQLRQQTLQLLPYSVEQMQSQHIARAYIESLRKENKIKIKQELLDKLGAEQ